MIFNKFKKPFEIIYMTRQCEQKESQTKSEMGNCAWQIHIQEIICSWTSWVQMDMQFQIG
jgi:hypothetical protein